MNDSINDNNIISHAAEVASAVVKKAEEVASRVASESEDRNTQSLVEALRQVFGENEEAKRFVDVSRIPLICQSILQIHMDIKDIKQMNTDAQKNYITNDQFWPVKSVVYGAISITLIAVFSALVYLVVKK